MENLGLVASINTRSETSIFSATENNYIGDVVLLIDENLQIKWKTPFDTLLCEGGMQVTNECIYLLNYKNKYSKLDFKGNIIFEKQLYDEEKSTTFVGMSICGLMVQCDDDITVYQNDTAQLTFKLRSGLAEKVIDLDNGFIIVSENETGELPYQPNLSRVLNSSQLVYSSYDMNGNLLWRKAHDNTPEVFGENNPCWDYPLRTN
ncbi:hypothetical protein SDC9_150218 [bioreactor metagenome]|uniref:Uncharacterized protein n=1 Tax=bioreactor metagenome TaxID=1076179 RepID=A0A645ELV5_9ZZZZ